MARILIAQQINRTLGGIAVLPWELDQLPEEWELAFEMLIDDLPKMRSGMQELDAAFERSKAKFARRQ